MINVCGGMKYSDCFPDRDFTLKALTLLEWTDKDGQNRTLRIRDELSPHWHDMGLLLGISMSRLDGILAHRLGDVRQCFRDVLYDWIQNGSPDYPATWEGLLNLLRDMKLSSLASSLELALRSFQGE